MHCKVADMVVKAPDVKFVLAQAPSGGLRAWTPRKFIKLSETPFPAFLRQDWSSSLVSKRCLSKKKKN